MVLWHWSKVFDRFEILSILKICCQRRSESLKDEKKQKIVPLGSIKAKGRSSKSCLSQVFNFKLSCFAVVKESFNVRTRPHLKLINRPKFCPPVWSFSLVVLNLKGWLLDVAKPTWVSGPLHTTFFQIKRRNFAPSSKGERSWYSLSLWWNYIP